MFRNKLILGVGTAVALGCGFSVLANPAQANADTVTSTGIEHTVVQGDTLWGLSQKYGVSLQNVFNTNNKSETNSFLQIGDQIFIPGAKTVQTTAATTQRTNTLAIGSTNSASTSTSTASSASGTSTASTTAQVSSTAHATQATTAARKTASATSSSSVATPVAQSSSTTATASTQTTQNANASTNTNRSTASSSASSTSASTVTTGGSTYSQFIAAGGTPSLWSNVVVPESGGNPSASNGQYHGLGQTAESWGQGSVASQTQGMVNYAVSRYGSISNAISFRTQHGWW
jgi:hypothetical protein